MEINNEKLIELIKKMKEEKTPESQERVITEILRAKFMCPIVMEGAPKGGGKVRITKDTKLQFNYLKTKDDKNFLMAFTSEEEIYKCQQAAKKQQTIIYTFEDYATIVLKNDNFEGFVIDPKGVNLALNKEMIKRIRENLTKTDTIEQYTQIQLRPLASNSQELTEKLVDIFMNIPEIKVGYLLTLVKDNEESYYVVIDSNGNEKEHFNKIASGAIPYLNGKSLGMDNVRSEIGRNVIGRYEPIYIKVEEK